MWSSGLQSLALVQPTSNLLGTLSDPLGLSFLFPNEELGFHV